MKIDGNKMSENVYEFFLRINIWVQFEFVWKNF